MHYEQLYYLKTLLRKGSSEGAKVSDVTIPKASIEVEDVRQIEHT